MGTAKIANSLNKTLHLTGIGLAVQAFYINLTLDSALGGEYLELAPAGPPIINPASVWDINGVPVQYGYNKGDQGTAAGQVVAAAGAIRGHNNDVNEFRDRNGHSIGTSGVRNGYDVGQTSGGGQLHGVTAVQGNAYGDISGRNKGHQAAGFSTNYKKNENGNRDTYYDDGLGHGDAVRYGHRDQRFKDGIGNAYAGGIHDSSLKTDAARNQDHRGTATGYHTSNNGGLTLTGADLYREGLVRGVGATGTVVPITPAPLLLRQPILLPPRPVSMLDPTFGRSPASAPPIYQSALRPSSPYVIPTPNKLYVDRPTQ